MAHCVFLVTDSDPLYMLVLLDHRVISFFPGFYCLFSFFSLFPSFLFIFHFLPSCCFFHLLYFALAQPGDVLITTALFLTQAFKIRR